MSERVEAYYDRFDEWGRLDSPPGRLEFERTLAHISEALEPRSVILDLGGGPGRYAVALAADGHTVWLIDISANQVEEARSRAIEAGVEDRMPFIRRGSAEDLSAFESASFEAVLALGPFYHLIDAPARARAASEILRVLRPGGLAFVSFIPRLSGLAGLIPRAAQDPAQVTPAVIRRVADEGVFLNPTDRGFQSGYYPSVSEISELFASTGFVATDLLSVRGLYFGVEEAVAAIREKSPNTAAAFEQVSTPLSRNPEIISLGGHALLVLRRPPSSAERRSPH